MSRRKNCCSMYEDYPDGNACGICGLNPCTLIIFLLILASTKLLENNNAIVLILLYWLCCSRGTRGFGCCPGRGF